MYFDRLASTPFPSAAPLARFQLSQASARLALSAASCSSGFMAKWQGSVNGLMLGRVTKSISSGVFRGGVNVVNLSVASVYLPIAKAPDGCGSPTSSVSA